MWKCPPSTILVPVDFGEASSRALQVAAALSARLGARLRVIHAETFEAPPYFTHEQLETIGRERRAGQARADHFLRGYVKHLGVDQVETSVLDAPATEAILEAARTADLVVMGTHGRRGPSRWWMGSVAERVIRESAAPVLVVRADLGAHAPEVFERPLVVAPGPEAPAEAMRVATGLAAAFGGRVSEPIARCEADMASERQATVMVVSRGAPHFAGLAVERWIRSCGLPMLFVPSTTLEPVES